MLLNKIKECVLKSFFLGICIMVAFSTFLQAEAPIEIYYARLGSQDHYNSRGNRLESVAGIIRQDRANYHKFYRRDSEDTGDSYFASKSNRAVLERMLNNGYASRSTRNAILYGNPLILVRVYNRRIEVELR